MGASQYWPFAQEYSIWNATVAAPQFWKKISNHMSSAMPWIDSMQPSSVVTTHNKYEIYEKKYSSVTL